MKSPWILLALAALAAPAARAQMAEAPAVFAKLKPKVGAWAEYSYQSNKDGALKSKGKMRMSVVGKDGDAYWLENKISADTPKPKKGSGVMIMKMLVPKVGGAAQKMYMKNGNMVMDMSGMIGASMKKRFEEGAKTKLKPGAEETVKVPAGKFTATHYTFDNGKASGDTWLKPGVGPYGLIKQTHKSERSDFIIELLSSGDGAKSELDESQAKPFPAMGGMPGGMPPGAAPAGGAPGQAPPGMPNMSDIMNRYRNKGGANSQ